MGATTWWHERIVVGARVVLGLPAPRQPLARRARRDELWQLRRSHEGDRRAGPRPSDLDALAARVDASRTAYRWSYARDLGDVRLVVVDSRAARVLTPTTARCSTTTRRRGSTSRCAATSSTCSSAPPCRSCCPRACTTSRRGRGGGQRRLGPTGRRVGREAAPGRRPRALGGLPGGVPAVARHGPGGRRRQAGPAPADRDVPVRRRAPLLRRRGRADPLGRRQPRSCRPSARRSATRCRAGCGSRPRRSRTPSPDRSGKLVARTARVPSPPFPWQTWPAPGSTTASRSSRTAPTGCALRWYQGGVVAGDHLHPRLDTIAEVLVEPR